MIAFAFLDEAGFPTGGGMRGVLPEGAVKITSPFTTADLPRIRFQGGRWQERNDLTPPARPTAKEATQMAEAALAAARSMMTEQINRRAGELRKRIYTDIPGQDALYLEKRAEAVAYVREVEQSGEPKTLDDYPLLSGEVGITAPEAWHLAQIWLYRSDQFKALGAATERARMEAAVAIATAADFEALEKIEAEFVEALGLIPI